MKTFTQQTPKKLFSVWRLPWCETWRGEIAMDKLSQEQTKSSFHLNRNENLINEYETHHYSFYAKDICRNFFEVWNKLRCLRKLLWWTAWVVEILKCCVFGTIFYSLKVKFELWFINILILRIKINSTDLNES